MTAKKLNEVLAAAGYRVFNFHTAHDKRFGSTQFTNGKRQIEVRPLKGERYAVYPLPFTKKGRKITDLTTL